MSGEAIDRAWARSVELELKKSGSEPSIPLTLRDGQLPSGQPI